VRVLIVIASIAVGFVLVGRSQASSGNVAEAAGMTLLGLLGLLPAFANTLLTAIFFDCRDNIFQQHFKRKLTSPVIVITTRKNRC